MNFWSAVPCAALARSWKPSLRLNGPRKSQEFALRVGEVVFEEAVAIRLETLGADEGVVPLRTEVNVGCAPEERDVYSMSGNFNFSSLR